MTDVKMHDRCGHEIEIDLRDPPFSVIDCLVEVLGSIEEEQGEERDYYYEAKQVWDAVLGLAGVIPDD